MFKSASLSFITPFVKSQTKTKVNNTKSLKPISWAGAKPASRSRSIAMPSSLLSVFSLFLVAGTLGFLLLHLFWVNTYSSKGFELTKAQTAIAEQTELQKKLLIQQSMLSSMMNLNNLDKTGMVPVAEAEQLTAGNFAVAK